MNAAPDVLEVPMFRSPVLLRRLSARLHVNGPEAGMTTAEYAVNVIHLLPSAT